MIYCRFLSSLFLGESFYPKKTNKTTTSPIFQWLVPPLIFKCCWFFSVKNPWKIPTESGFSPSKHPSEHLKLASHSRHRRGYLLPAVSPTFRPRGWMDGRQLRNGWGCWVHLWVWIFRGGPGFEKCRVCTKFRKVYVCIHKYSHAVNGEISKSHQLFDEATWCFMMFHDVTSGKKNERFKPVPEVIGRLCKWICRWIYFIIRKPSQLRLWFVASHVPCPPSD